jgi:hypothetical protein
MMAPVESDEQHDVATNAGKNSVEIFGRQLSRKTVIGAGVAASALIAAIVIAALFTQSGDDPNAVKPKSQVDIASWRAEVAAMPGSSSHPDMDTLYDVAVKNCNAPQDQITSMLTLSGANPTLLRSGMRYVCPGRAHMIDDGLTQIQKNDTELTQACRTQPNLRTENQSQLIEAIGPGACTGS